MRWFAGGSAQKKDSRSSPRALTAAKAWSGRRDSNPRPSPWQGDALPLSHFRQRRSRRFRRDRSVDTPSLGVGKERLELSRTFVHMILNHARLPIPTLPRGPFSGSRRDRGNGARPKSRIPLSRSRNYTEPLPTGSRYRSAPAISDGRGAGPSRGPIPKGSPRPVPGFAIGNPEDALSRRSCAPPRPN